MYIQVSHGVRNGVIKLETKLKLVSVFFFSLFLWPFRTTYGDKFRRYKFFKIDI